MEKHLKEMLKRKFPKMRLQKRQENIQLQERRTRRSKVKFKLKIQLEGKIGEGKLCFEVGNFIQKVQWMLTFLFNVN